MIASSCQRCRVAAGIIPGYQLTSEPSPGCRRGRIMWRGRIGPGTWQRTDNVPATWVAALTSLLLIAHPPPTLPQTPPLPPTMGTLPPAVLAVAPAIARGLDAPDASALCALVAKCGDSLQDGRRLENIAWRLAFRALHPPPRAAAMSFADGAWPLTPESVCSDDQPAVANGGAGSFFLLAPRKPATTTPPANVRPAGIVGRIICDILTPQSAAVAQKETQTQTQAHMYPTPASSSSSTSSSAVSIAVEPSPPQLIRVPRVVILTPTPNLTPHPTPPATPLLGASSPTSSVSVSPSSSPAPSCVSSATSASLAPAPPHNSPSPHSSPPPAPAPLAPLFLPRSATRGMGAPLLPVFPPTAAAAAAAAVSSFAPAAQSTHILPLGGRTGLGGTAGGLKGLNGNVSGATVGASVRSGGSKFFLQASASHSSHSSSYSHSGSGSGSASYSNGSGSGSSESSRERGEDGCGVRETESIEQDAHSCETASRGRVRVANLGVSGGRSSSASASESGSGESSYGEGETEVKGETKPQATQQPRPKEEVKSKSSPQMEKQEACQQPAQAPQTQKPQQMLEPVQATHTAQQQLQPNPSKSSTSTKQQKKEQPQQQQPQPQPHPPMRTVSEPFLGGLGLVTGVNGVNGKKAPAPVVDADDARSLSSLATSSSHVRVRARGKQPARPTLRSQHSRSRSRRGAAAAPNALGLPSNLAAATALVERTMSNTRSGRRVLVLATSDEEDGEWSDDEDEESVSVENEVEEGEEGWEDESELSTGPGHANGNAKAPPPSLQQHAPQAHGHTDAHALRQLPTRPLHRSEGHLPALAPAAVPAAPAPAPTKHHHTTSAQNARTARALKATMSATTLSSAMLEAQRQRQLFVKAPRGSYENLTQIASNRIGGLSLLLKPQLQQQQYPGTAELPSPRVRPAGGFGGLGLTMSSTRPPVTGGVGAELSPIPPTPATGVQAVQQARHHQQLQQLSQQQPTRAPVRPGLSRALSSSALPPHFGGGAGTSGSFGKSSIAGPVVTGAAGAQVGSGATTNGSSQNGSAGRGGYRPKGPPVGMEIEYDEDDEEEEGTSDADGGGNGARKGKGRARDEGLQLSKSVAQEKLRLLAEKSAIASRVKVSGETSAEAERRRLYEEAGVVPWAAVNHSEPASNNSGGSGYAEPAQSPPPDRSMASVPVGFPYNLPAPAPPSTPRATRQQMLRNEMSESLRHNLLWQRKLSRGDFIGPQPRRTRSTANVPAEGGRQAEKSLVRVTVRAPGAPERTLPPPMDPLVPDGAPRKKLVRNLSWADNTDYHLTGW
ncbi:hypothetical protein B0H10DRAFT_1114497 [Mycena sp. CBHHK59/15]|nr:hypothetical protein B0H10DRAFT_1114497 [Mycena sp. CBHHK59/15]